MDEATKLIERAEKESGCLFDENGMNNMAMCTILGAISRKMGISPKSYDQRQDMAAGIEIRHKMTPENIERERSMNMFAHLISGGMDPDMAKKLME